MKRTRLLPGALASTLLCLALAAAAARASPTATPVCGALAPGTTWTAAGSPYVTTCDVEVPAGAVLAIEPGVVVQPGAMHRVQVSGSLRARGTTSAPIRFEAANPQEPWGTLAFASGSGPSELSYVQFSGGGAGRREMVGIESDAVLVDHCTFGTNAGVAVEIKKGASPTITHSRFVNANDEAADPPAALRIRGPSDAVITENVFMTNDYAVYREADANPRFEGNRFALNGHDGVVYAGRVSRAVSLQSLGPRSWSYAVVSPGIVVEAAGQLTIGPGTTVKLFPGNGIRVAGTLAIRGQAANEVLLTTGAASPSPGQWTDIEFGASSVDYVPEVEEGCVVEHAILEYGGARQTGVIHVRASSPLIANNVIRHSGKRGITVTGAESRPEIFGNLFDANTDDPEGVAVFATGNAIPTIHFNIFRNNTVGVRAERGAEPRVEPHNWFDRNLQYGVYNEDFQVCVPASDNDWGASSGPNDPAELADDACGMTRNESDEGDLVSNHVRYIPWEGQIPRPVLTAPRCGTYSNQRPTIEGLAPAGSTVHIYDQQQRIGSATTTAGPESMLPFRFVPQELAPGSHVLRAQAERGTERSGLSEPLDLFIEPGEAIDPARLTVHYDLDGTHFVQPYASASGCLSLASGDWRIRVHPVDQLALRAGIACPSGGPPQPVLEYSDQEWPMSREEDTLYEATFPFGDGGPVAIRLDCGSTARSVVLGTIEREFNGIVYDADLGPAFGRIAGARVTLYEWHGPSGDWRVWPAAEYYSQTNPIVTGPGGWSIFYPPPGLYYARAEAAGYQAGVTSEITITSEPFVANLPLRRRGGALALPMLLRDHRLSTPP